MKKVMLFSAVIVALSGVVSSAGHFIDVLPPASTSGCVPVSNGYDYQCSNDTNAPAVLATTPVGLPNKTLTQINSLLPATTGQLVYCSNCTSSQICVSSAATTGAWVAISTATNVVNHCN